MIIWSFLSLLGVGKEGWSVDPKGLAFLDPLHKKKMFLIFQVVDDLLLDEENQSIKTTIHYLEIQKVCYGLDMCNYDANYIKGCEA